MSPSCELTRLVKVAGLSAGATLFIVNELGLISKVEGNSMQPTFNPYCGQKNEHLRQLVERGLSRESIRRELKTRLQQDRVILNKWSTRDKRNLEVGDVVILVSPRDPTKIMIKRITAMPGDAIYIIETGETKVIDEGHCWVEGDNQQSSYDSNNFGQVPLGLIEGKVCFIVWPLHRIGRIICDPTLPYPRSKTILLSRKGDSEKVPPSNNIE
jgi:signal peptidase I